MHLLPASMCFFYRLSYLSVEEAPQASCPAALLILASIFLHRNLVVYFHYRYLWYVTEFSILCIMTFNMNCSLSRNGNEKQTELDMRIYITCPSGLLCSIYFPEQVFYSTISLKSLIAPILSKDHYTVAIIQYKFSVSKILLRLHFYLTEFPICHAPLYSSYFRLFCTLDISCSRWLIKCMEDEFFWLTCQ